jgi:hypothetical protein
MQGEDGEGLRAACDFSHIPPPSEATWAGEWYFVEGSCGHQHWLRPFGSRSWTVETSSLNPVGVELAGSQFSDESVVMWVCLEGALDLNADEALMLAATLSRAAGELERVQGGGL